ncbi:MAG: hypothetical protein ACPGMR_11555 [Pontibacterium sp.]
MSEPISTEQFYGVERAIMCPSPYVTAREFARVSGLTYSSVKAKMDRGELPTYRPGDKKGGTVFVNMAALMRDALEQEG